MVTVAYSVVNVLLLPRRYPLQELRRILDEI